MQQFLLLFCLLTAGRASPRPEADQASDEAKRADDLNAANVMMLVQQQASTIDRLQADLTAYKNQVQGELSAYGNQVVSMSSQLQAMQHKLDAASKSVAFTARISIPRDNGKSGLPITTNETLIFDDVVTNMGGAYNPVDGTFTAPVAGTYIASLQVMSVNGQNIELAIVKNGAILDLVYAEGYDSRDNQGASQVTAHLSAGDRLWVRQSWGSAVRGDYWTVFTGFLLQED